MPDAKPSVLIIDDDPEFRDSVGRLLRTVGLNTRQFSSVSDFLSAEPSDGPTCLVLDIRMPGASGLELQRDLAAAARPRGPTGTSHARRCVRRVAVTPRRARVPPVDYEDGLNRA